MTKKPDNKTKLEKTANIISCIAFCIWILFEILDKSITILVNHISIFAICVSESICMWKKSRIVSFIAIAGAVVMLAVIVYRTVYNAWF